MLAPLSLREMAEKLYLIPHTFGQFACCRDCPKCEPRYRELRLSKALKQTNKPPAGKAAGGLSW
jgi:hypothetical protein